MNSIDYQRVPAYYHKYIQKVNADTVLAALQNQQEESNNLLTSIPEEKWLYKYAEGKWTIKELVQHVTDAERIFCYRALCFSRNEKSLLPGFDENDYVIASKANNRSKNSILNELKTVQAATLSLFASFDETQLKSSGIANGNTIYVKAIGYIIAGHAVHHTEILKERYL